MHKKLIFFLIIQIFITSCSSNETVTVAPSEISDRISRIQKTIQKNKPIPSKIIDVNYIHIQYGNGLLGPSDTQLFLRIVVPPNEIGKWINGLKAPLNNSGKYSKPKKTYPWWIAEIDFNNQRLYETKTFFGRNNGWLCVDKNNGYIYVHTFTS